MDKVTLDRAKDYCALCGSNDIIHYELNHFNKVCEAHKKYANYFQLDKARLGLGILDKLPDACCSICQKQLSPEEIKSIEWNHFTKTCTEHRWMAKFYIYSVFSEQYKAGLPFTYNGVVYSAQHPTGQRV